MLEYAKEALTALNLYEQIEKIPYPALTGAVLLLLFGLSTLFFGYKFRNLWFAIMCLIAGTYVGYWLHTSHGIETNLSIALALLSAVLFVFTYKIGLIGVMFLMGYYLLHIIAGYTGAGMLVSCAIAAFLVLFLERWVTTLVTILFGAVVTIKAILTLLPMLQDKLPFAGTILLWLQPGKWQGYTFFAALLLFGFLAQAGLFGSNPLFRKKS